MARGRNLHSNPQVILGERERCVLNLARTWSAVLGEEDSADVIPDAINPFQGWRFS
jgi:hypothetical protein